MTVKTEEVKEKEIFVGKEFSEYIREKVNDPGLDETVKKLTPEKIQKAYNSVFGKISSRVKAIIETCMHCGLCAEACQWYLSNDKDPTYAPVAKMRMTAWELINRKGQVDPEFIKQCARIVFTECNICHRCSMYCPFGLDITFIIGLVRRMCFLLGVMPQRQLDQAQAHIVTQNQVWLSQNDWIDTLLWREEEGGPEFKNLRIPIDKEGAEIIFYPLGAEPKTTTEHIDRFAKIMQVAGVDWTMSSRDTWDCSSMSMFVRDFATMQRIVKGLFENAARLKVKRIVLTECGHATFAVAGMTPPMLGYKELPFDVLHAGEFYYELITSGRLKLDPNKKIKEPVTLHDPCNIIRRKGISDKIRYVANVLCEDFREMYPNKEHNFCCNAGGGLAALAQWTAHKAKGNRIKVEQILRTGAKIVLTPCHNCHRGIGDIIKYWKLDAKAKYFDEYITKAMIIPDELIDIENKE